MQRFLTTSSPVRSTAAADVVVVVVVVLCFSFPRLLSSALKPVIYRRPTKVNQRYPSDGLMVHSPPTPLAAFPQYHTAAAAAAAAVNTHAPAAPLPVSLPGGKIFNRQPRKCHCLLRSFRGVYRRLVRWSRGIANASPERHSGDSAPGQRVARGPTEQSETRRGGRDSRNDRPRVPHIAVTVSTKASQASSVQRDMSSTDDKPTKGVELNSFRRETLSSWLRWRRPLLPLLLLLQRRRCVKCERGNGRRAADCITCGPRQSFSMPQIKIMHSKCQAYLQVFAYQISSSAALSCFEAKTRFICLEKKTLPRAPASDCCRSVRPNCFLFGPTALVRTKSIEFAYTFFIYAWQSGPSIAS
jgi:hypothetical protein